MQAHWDGHLWGQVLQFKGLGAALDRCLPPGPQRSRSQNLPESKWEAPSGLCLVGREEQEPGEDAVCAFGPPNHRVLLCRLQPDGLSRFQPEHHAPGGDLVGIVDVVAEGHDLLASVAGRGLLEMDAQVAPGGDVVGEVIQPRHLADEAAVAGLIVVVEVGDDPVESDGLEAAGWEGDGPEGREG